KLKEYDAALAHLKDAIVTTRRYQDKVFKGSPRDANTEDELSSIWFQVSQKIYPFDEPLAHLCSVKEWGWADEKVWNLPENKDLPLRLEEMISAHQSAMRSVGDHREGLKEIKNLVQQIAAHDIAAGKLRHNAWLNGSFYLVAVLAIFPLLAGIATQVKVVLVP